MRSGISSNALCDVFDNCTLDWKDSFAATGVTLIRPSPSTPREVTPGIDNGDSKNVASVMGSA